MFVSRYDAASQIRVCIYAFSDGAEIDPTALPPMPMTDSPHSRAVRTGEVVVTRDFETAMRNTPRVDVGTHLDPRLPAASIAMPMVAHGRILGGLEIQTPEPGAFDESHVAPLRLAANLAALAIENGQLLEARVGRVSRSIARELLTDLARHTHLAPSALRDMGRRLGSRAEAKTVPEAASEFVAMGLGHLELVATEGDTFRFEGRDLLEKQTRATLPTCHVALGFLEGIVMRSAGAASALGTELRCESLGHKSCVFVVAPRG
jgi:predicted hydrocarbon binding protein